MKEGQRNFAGFVEGKDAIGHILASGRGGMVAPNRQLKRDNGAFRRVGDARPVAPVHQ